jgi:hypothetical protein
MTCKKLKEDRKAASVCKYKRKEVVNILMWQTRAHYGRQQFAV